MDKIEEKLINTSGSAYSGGNTHGTTNTNDFNTTTNNNVTNKQDIESMGIDQGYNEGDNPVIEINHKLNLMKLAKDQFDEDEKSEDNTLVLNRFNGQPVVIYNMGPEDEYVEAITSEYSKYCHPYINLVYGYKHADNGDLLIVREHVHGKNYYTVTNYVHLGDRLIAFYKCLTLIEYIHSFKAFLRIIRPEKFILGGGLTSVKLVDVIKHDNRYLIKIQTTTKVDDSMRFICPELYDEDLSDDSLERSVDYDKVKRSDLWSVGCMLYYAITTKKPWDNGKFNKKDEIKAEYMKYQKNKEFIKANPSKKDENLYPTIFFKDSELNDGNKENPKPIEPELIEYLHKCFDNTWGEDLTPFREALEKRENIAKFIGEAGGDLEMNYDDGKI
jgi:serine/threonine protein kinase